MPGLPGGEESPLTIQGVPKRSVTVPQASAQKVSWSGAPTFPPGESASKARFASAAVG